MVVVVAADRRLSDVSALKLTLARSALNVIEQEVATSQPNLETGGILLGRRRQDVLEITRVGTPGPAAVRTPTYFLRDLVHSQSIAREQELEDGSVWLGEWHTHPRGPRTPSATDARTYETLASDPDLQFSDGVLSIILVPVNDHYLLSAWLYRDQVLKGLDVHLV